MFRSIIKLAASGVFGLFKLIFKIFVWIFIAPLIFLIGTLGFFKGFFIYLGYMMVLFALFIKIFEEQAANVAWDHMTNYTSLSQSEQLKLLDMAEMAAYAYVTDAYATDHLENLKRKGYSILEPAHVNDYGLTYVTLKKDNTIYLSFRGSTTISDWADDIKMIAGKAEEHMARFRNAANVTLDLIRRYPDCNIVLIGHSLGGSTVQYVLNNVNHNNIVAAYTFNPLGIPGDIPRYCSHKLTDVVHEADIAQLTMGDKHIVGRGILVKWENLDSMISQHSIENTIYSMKYYCHQLTPYKF